MTEIIQKNKSYYLEINNIFNSNIQQINHKTSFRHLIVFCGKGLNFDFINNLNLLAKLTNKNSLYIGITDRGDLDDFKIDDSIYKIPLYISERNIPMGYFNENFLISELKSTSLFIEKYFKK